MLLLDATLLLLVLFLDKLLVLLDDFLFFSNMIVIVGIAHRSGVVELCLLRSELRLELGLRLLLRRLEDDLLLLLRLNWENLLWLLCLLNLLSGLHDLLSWLLLRLLLLRENETLLLI